MLLKWALAAVATLALLGAAVGLAASIDVGGADRLGSGSAPVLAPTGSDGDPVVVTDVKWWLDPGDSTRVVQADIKFAVISPTTVFDRVSFTLKDSDGNVLRDSGALYAPQALNGIVSPTTISWDLTVAGVGVLASAIAQLGVTVVDAAP